MQIKKVTNEKTEFQNVFYKSTEPLFWLWLWLRFTNVDGRGLSLDGSEKVLWKGVPNQM